MNVEVAEDRDLQRPLDSRERQQWIDGLTPFGLINAVLRQRGWVFLFAIILPSIVLVAALLWPRSYTSTASFIPESKRSGASNLSGIAAQLGVNLPAADAAQSPPFYVDLLTSRGILRSVADSAYVLSHGGERFRGPLTQFVKPEEADSNRRIDATLDWLRKRVSANASAKTAVVTLSVTTRSPDLSQQIARRLVAEVNRFNLEARQTQASAERRFAEQRVAETRASLSEAEGALQNFLQHNRGYDRTSEPKFEEDRLDREVRLRQQVYSTLAQAYEQAKIDEVRDTPVITIVEQANLPARPDSRGLVPLTLFLLVIGITVGVAVALARDFFSQVGRRAVDDYQEFRALRRAAAGDITHPWRPVARALRRDRGAIRRG